MIRKYNKNKDKATRENVELSKIIKSMVPKLKLVK